MERSGRMRWQMIKALARKGPIYAFQSWCRAVDLSRRYMEVTTPEIHDIIVRPMLCDRAHALTISKPTMTPEEGRLRCELARHDLAERGQEWTPAEYRECLEAAVGSLRSSVSGDMPVPEDDLAALELFMHMLKQR